LVDGEDGVPAAATHEMVNAGREMADATAEMPGVPLQPPD